MRSSQYPSTGKLPMQAPTPCSCGRLKQNPGTPLLDRIGYLTGNDAVSGISAHMFRESSSAANPTPKP